MPLQSSGPISMSDIRSELGLSNQIDLLSISTANYNSYSTNKPNGIAPHSMSEFYGYQHIATITSNAQYDNSNQGNLYYTITAGYATRYRIQSSYSGDGAWQTLPYNDGNRTNAGNTSGSIGINYSFFGTQNVQFDVLDSGSRYLISVSWGEPPA